MDKRQFIKSGLIGMGCLMCMRTKTLFAANDVPAKHRREALFYSETPKGLRCLICPNECTLKSGELSDCRNRINKDGKLYTIAYGNPCAIHVDPIEKKPLYHFLPTSRSFSLATAGCNLACLNCQNWNISQTSPTETRNYDLMPEAVVDQALKNNCQTIASAGYINPEPQRHLIKHIDGANIDLKSFSESIYLKLNAGKLQPVLDSLKLFRESGVWLEITNLVVPSWTDDIEMIARMCDWLYDNGFENAPLHFSRFHPMYKLTQLPPTPVSILVKARETAMKAGLKFVYIGNVPGNDASNTYCPGCKELIIERRGYRIIQINLSAGKCGNCGEVIPGVWD
jgi:pyruvate formate lyase activating enzyme